MPSGISLPLPEAIMSSWGAIIPTTWGMTIPCRRFRVCQGSRKKTGVRFCMENAISLFGLKICLTERGA